ncbi:MAG: rhomboid family intramembrane serine protease [Lysobacteraceae bacterium]|jgi:membrane associated rhomboid family serine protease
MTLDATLILIALTCLVSWLAWRNPRLLQRLMLWSPAVTRGRQYERLVSYGFVHADAMHLLFNMITLYFFGGLIERAFAGYLGVAGFVGFYLSALLVAALPGYLRHRNDPDYRTLGASGAVAAILFAFVLIQPWALIFVFFIPVPAIIFALLYVGYSIWAERRGKDNINHSAHLWGAGYGIVFSLAMEPRILGLFLDRLFDP